MLFISIPETQLYFGADLLGNMANTTNNTNNYNNQ